MKDAQLEPGPDYAARLEGARDRLYAKLEEGYTRIEAKLEAGEDTGEWERFWRQLLREYERVCDELQRDLAV